MIKLHKPKVLHFETQQMTYDAVSNFAFDYLTTVTALEGGIRLAVASGPAVQAVLSRLMKNTLFPWEETEIYTLNEVFGEEFNHKKQIQDSASEDVLEEMKELVTFDQSDGPTDSIQKVETKLSSLDGDLFDMVIVEIRKDGGIAGLYANSDGLKHSQNRCVINKTPNDKKVLLSMNIETILSSREVVAVIEGKDKEYILSEMLSGSLPAVEFPAKFLLAHPKLTIFQWLGEQSSE